MSPNTSAYIMPNSKTNTIHSGEWRGGVFSREKGPVERHDQREGRNIINGYRTMTIIIIIMMIMIVLEHASLEQVSNRTFAYESLAHKSHIFMKFYTIPQPMRKCVELIPATQTHQNPLASVESPKWFHLENPIISNCKLYPVFQFPAHRITRSHPFNSIACQPLPAPQKKDSNLII